MGRLSAGMSGSNILDRDQRAVRVMIVDNDAQSLATRSAIFGTFGCLVIGAPSQRDAEKELDASPVPDVIVTDLHMPDEHTAGDPDRDKSGLRLFEYVRAKFPTVPIGCYSAYYTTAALPEAVLDRFDFKFKRGLQTPQQLEVDIANAVELGEQQMRRRQAEYDDLLAELRGHYAAQYPKAEIFRRLSLEHDDSTLVEGRLKEAGYRLRLVGTGGALSSAEPLIIWTCSTRAGVEAEVYGHGELYSFGSSETEAIERLLELMRHYREVLAQSGNDEHLLAFLDRSFG